MPKNPTAQYTTPRTSSFFGAHNSFYPAGAMIQRLAILAVHLSYVCAAFGNKKVGGDPSLTGKTRIAMIPKTISQGVPQKLSLKAWELL